ncbi:tetratricopeptide repeat protein [Streptomyces clavifer]|uniref:tetratricopeptide repeat protein n=1 Tax=Streptomyces clavifer TaxID=68188 RepID=UPI00339E0F15
MSQSVRVENGHGYGVIGADLHVFQDRGPVYLLSEHRSPEEPAASWLSAQPSRLLNSRFAVVDFTERDRELDDLARWRDDNGGARLTARLLHAPGGQGKTRLAAEFAGHSARSGWKVVTATHGLGTVLPPSPGEQDLRPGNSEGLLLIVDYADRWPLSHLAWLLSNGLLHQDLPTRLLLIGRSAHSWPAVRAVLDELRADTDAYPLPPLDSPDGTPDIGRRERMFAVARDCFARRYGLTDPAKIRTISSPSVLSGVDFGLVLSLHMAALTAVDAQVRGVPAPQETADLSAYLLDRERKHWTRLYEGGPEGADFRTPPGVMGRTVFTASLAGATSHRKAITLLDQVGTEIPPERVLADHAVCYPPSEQGTVLEPLYPDRLAEDFLAMTLPGHQVSGHPPTSWGEDTVTALLRRDADGTAPEHLPRTLAYLGAAAGPDRWPHLAGLLNSVLRADPALAVEAGGAALHTLAQMPGIAPDVLEAIDVRLPKDGHTDLDLAAATVAYRRAHLLLADTQDPLLHAQVRENLGVRLQRAGLHEESVTALSDAIPAWAHLARADLDGYGGRLAYALASLSSSLGLCGRHEESVRAAREAEGICRQINEANLSLSAYVFTYVLDGLGVALLKVGEDEEAAEHFEQAAALGRRLVEAVGTGGAGNAEDVETCDAALAVYLVNQSSALSRLGRSAEALSVAEESESVHRRLMALAPHRYAPGLAVAVQNSAMLLRSVGRDEEALVPIQEAVELLERLAEVNGQAYELQLAQALGNLSLHLADVGREAEAMDPAWRVVAIHRRLAESSPDAYRSELARSLLNLGSLLDDLDRPQEALTATAEAVEIRRALVARNPKAHREGLADAVGNLGNFLMAAGQEEEAIACAREAEALHRQLATQRPAAHEQKLAVHLMNLASLLWKAGRAAEGLHPAEESVALARRLVQQDPQAHEPRLAQILKNYAVLLRDTGRPEAALAVAEEATTLHQRLAERSSAVHAAESARTRMSYAFRLAEAGRQRQAAEEVAATLAVWRRLATDNPSLYEPKLLSALGSYRTFLAAADRPEEASAVQEEIVALHRVRAAAHPDVRDDGYGRTLFEHAEQLAELGRLPEALDAYEELAAEVRKPDADGVCDERRLGMTLTMYSLKAQGAGHWSRAVGAAEEAIGLYRGMMAEEPDAEHEIGLALSLWLCAMARDGARDDLRRALECVDEAVVILRRSSDEPPDRPTGLLMQALTARAGILDSLGQ